jgi:hypothetical protein
MSTISKPPNADLIPWLSYRALLLGTLQVMAALCFVAQLVIDPRADNLECVGLAVASSSLLLQYLWRSEAMTTHPLSSLALLGFTASSQLIALISQTLDGTAFIQFLRAPQLTFTVLAVAHVTAVLAHFAYRNFQPLSGATAFLAENLLAPLNIHRVPTPWAVWMLGGVGMVGHLAGGGATGDVGGKFLEGLSFMVWLPFMLPLFRDLLGASYVNLKAHLPLLVGWALVIAGMALAKNHRATVVIGPIMLALVFVVYKCRGQQLVSRRMIKGLGLATVAMALVMPQISDFFLAMQIARDKRGSVSQYEMATESLEKFMDKDTLERTREASVNNLSVELFDETYVSNVAISRFTETKFHDNMLFFSDYLNEFDRRDLVQMQVDRVIALIPQNLLDALEIRLKKDTLAYSNGDFYVNRAIGAPLGSYVTGSMWADLYAVAGLWLPVAAAILFLFVFIALDCLTRFGPGYFISPIALCTAYQIYIYGLTGESVFNKFAFVTRGTIQPILLYALLLAVTAFVLRLFRQPAWVEAQPDTSFTIHR